jgi:bacterioferritin-associated ferredoxin
MILCQCAGVEEDTVRRLIRDGARTVAEISRRCGAGQTCPPCQSEIAQMLKLSAETEHDPGALGRVAPPRRATGSRRRLEHAPTG